MEMERDRREGQEGRGIKRGTTRERDKEREGWCEGLRAGEGESS